MTFQRDLTTEEIERYLTKGSQKAAQAFARAVDNPSILKTIYDAVLHSTDHTLDNLSKDGYAHKDDIYRGNGHSVSEIGLRRLMLCAVEAVQCLEELEPHIDKPDNISPDVDPALGLTRHMKLLRAVTVFRSDGTDDTPAMDVEKTIKGYRHTHQTLAA